MIEFGLKYLGHKAPFVLSPAYLPEPVQVHKDDGQILWFEDFIANRLMTDNPRMFEKVGERGNELISVETVEEAPQDKFVPMTKKGIQAYVKENFEVDLDMRKNRDTLIAEAKAIEEEHISIGTMAEEPE